MELLRLAVRAALARDVWQRRVKPRRSFRAHRTHAIDLLRFPGFQNPPAWEAVGRRSAVEIGER